MVLFNQLLMWNVTNQELTGQEYIFLVNQVSELNLKDQKQLEPL